MFVKVNDSCLVNTAQIVWIDTSAENWIVKLTDGSEHVVSDQDKFHTALGIINAGIKNNSFVK